jgi:hypothetical protein
MYFYFLVVLSRARPPGSSSNRSKPIFLFIRAKKKRPQIFADFDSRAHNLCILLVEGMFFVNQKWRKTRRRSTTRLLELTEICDSSNSAATGICHFKNIAI